MFFITCLWLVSLCNISVHASIAKDPYLIKLNGTEAVTFQVYSVKNQTYLSPLSLEALALTQLKISVDTEVYFDGTLDDIPEPVTIPIPLDADERLKLDIRFKFSEDADNRYQGVAYQLKWMFEVANSTGVTYMDMTGGATLYNNYNIDPGDVYGFNIVVENGNPSPEEPDDPIDPPKPTDPTDPGSTGPPLEPNKPPDDTGLPSQPIDPPSIQPSQPVDPSYPSVPPTLPSAPTEDPSQPSIPSNPSPNVNPSTPNLPSVPSGSNSGTIGLPTDPNSDTKPNDQEDSDDTTLFDDGRIPGGNREGGEGDKDGTSLDTGDYSILTIASASLPLLIGASAFLLLLIVFFIRTTAHEKQRHASK